MELNKSYTMNNLCYRMSTIILPISEYIQFTYKKTHEFYVKYTNSLAGVGERSACFSLVYFTLKKKK